MSDHDRLKEARGNLCLPVTLITCAHEGVKNVMTAAWVIPTSFEPLLINISIGLTRFSHDLIKHSGEFGINICAENQLDLAELCGNNSGTEMDKFEAGRIATRPGKMIKAPLIEGCAATIECSVEDSFVAGDHTVFVGRTLEYDENPELSPLLRFRGNFHGIGPVIGRDDHPAKV